MGKSEPEKQKRDDRGGFLRGETSAGVQSLHPHHSHPLLDGHAAWKGSKLPYYKFAKILTTFVCIMIVLWILLPAFLSIFAYHSTNLLIIIASIAAAVVAILLTFICSHFLPYTYDPYLYEEEWQLTRQISKSNGIEVIKSRAFEIVLKNTGEQPWRSKGGFVVRRSSEVYHSRWKTIIPIPRDIFLLPGKTTTLIPYTETYPHGAVKVHDFRCFGYDKGDWVRTVVKEADPNQKVALGQLDEQFEHLGPGQQWLEINETLVTGEGEQTVKLL